MDSSVDIFAEMETGSELGQMFKEALFGYKNNVWCKNKLPFCPAVCRYAVDVGYAYFSGSMLRSNLLELSFNDKASFDSWFSGCSRDNTYIIAYKPGCVPCARLMSALETVADSLKSSGFNVYKINTQKNYHNLLLDSIMNNGLEGTPTVLKIEGNSVVEVALKDVQRELICGQESKYISLHDLIKKSVFQKNLKMGVVISATVTIGLGVYVYYVKQKMMQKLNCMYQQMLHTYPSSCDKHSSHFEAFIVQLYVQAKKDLNNLYFWQSYDEVLQSFLQQFQEKYLLIYQEAEINLVKPV